MKHFILTFLLLLMFNIGYGQDSSLSDYLYSYGDDSEDIFEKIFEIREKMVSGEYDQYISFGYKLQNYRLDDPLGDFYLIRASNLLGRAQVNRLLGDNDSVNKHYQKIKKFSGLLDEEKQFAIDHPKEVKKVVKNGIDSKEKPINTDEVALKLSKVMDDQKLNDIYPKYGIVHKWSKSYLKKMRFKINRFGGKTVKPTFSKVLTALSCGMAAKFLTTGKELLLKDVILEQDDRSISLEKMFEMSYVLNDGDIYLTILTIENLLSENWINRYRAVLPITNKLQIITKQKGGDGDVFGSWYHFWGAALYSYISNKFTGKLIVSAETVISIFEPHSNINNERQEHYINIAGIEVGSSLKKLVSKIGRN